jgi:hypothetical protein
MRFTGAGGAMSRAIRTADGRAQKNLAELTFDEVY